MILVLGGTTEGRVLALYLQEAGYPVRLTTATAYGEELARRHGVVDVQGGELDEKSLVRLFTEEGFKVILDATHPHAEKIRELAQYTARKLNVPYGRFERPASQLTDHPLLYVTDSYTQAAIKAGELGNTLFLTVGSRRLSVFTTSPALEGKKLVVRVLPQAEVLNNCHRLGLGPDRIVAVQGPFTREANLWMFRHYGAQVVVSKESGLTGGFQAKWEACQDLNIPLVVIQRPPAKHPHCFNQLKEVKEFVEEVRRNG